MPRRSLGPLVRPAMYNAPSSRVSGCAEKLLLYTRTCTPRSSSFRILMTEYVPSSFGLYSTPNEDGTYSVIKILKLDDRGVHVRVYSNSFSAHPDTLEEGALYMAGS